MRGIYTLKDGNRIAAYLWSEFLDGEFYRGETDVVPIKKDKFLHDGKDRKVKVEEDGSFMWGSEKIYLKDFEADTVPVMAQRIKKAVEENDRWQVSEDEILATFLKYADDVIILADMPRFTTIIPMVGIGLTGDETMRVACVLSEDRYKKSSWHYKITLTPNDLQDKAMVASEHLYFGDFCSMLFRGNCELVSKAGYLTYLLQMSAAKAAKGKKGRSSIFSTKFYSKNFFNVDFTAK